MKELSTENRLYSAGGSGEEKAKESPPPQREHVNTCGHLTAWSTVKTECWCGGSGAPGPPEAQRGLSRRDNALT